MKDLVIGVEWSTERLVEYVLDAAWFVCECWVFFDEFHDFVVGDIGVIFLCGLFDQGFLQTEFSAFVDDFNAIVVKGKNGHICGWQLATISATTSPGAPGRRRVTWCDAS